MALGVSDDFSLWCYKCSTIMSAERDTDATVSTDLGVSGAGSVAGTSSGTILSAAVQEQIEAAVQAALTKALAPAVSASSAASGSCMLYVNLYL